MIKVILEDHGQDYLEWDIENGKVVACRPLQAWLWVGVDVHNENIRPGDFLKITDNNWQKRTLLYPVKSVVQEI